MDMLRFHKFTIGHAWMPEYGDPDTADGFDVLIRYSPLHNVAWRGVPYPAMLVTCGRYDDRVSPLHSFKFLAKLQAVCLRACRWPAVYWPFVREVQVVGREAAQTAPLLLRCETKGGHGAGKVRGGGGSCSWGIPRCHHHALWVSAAH